MERILTGETNYAKIAEHLYERAKSQQSQFGQTKFEISDFDVFKSFIETKPNALYYDIKQIATALNKIKGCDAEHKIIGEGLDEEDAIELTLIN